MVVCRMAKRKTKKSTMTCRLTMLGMEPPRDIMATFKSLFVEMILNGLKIFNILSALMKEI